MTQAHTKPTTTANKQQQTSWPNEVDRLAELQRQLCLQRHNAKRMRTRLVKEMLFNENFIDSNLRMLFAPKASFKKPPAKRRPTELKSQLSLTATIKFEGPSTSVGRLMLEQQKEVELHICKSASLERQLSLANDKLRKLIDELRGGGKEPHYSGFLRAARYSYSEHADDDDDSSDD